MKLPEGFLNKIQDILQDEFEDFLQSYSAPRTAGLRANRIKVSADDLKQMLSFIEDKVPWSDDGFYYKESEARPGKHPYYYAGLYYIQEPSAMLPAELLNVRAGDCVLDLCAAPGGKSIQLAGRLGNGLLVVNDINPHRAKVLLKNIERYGVTNAIVLNETPARIASVFGRFFDKILVDAPCSGEGMFHKEPDMAKEWSQQEVLKYVKWQSEILQSASEMLRSGGNLVYSTCTFSKEENEEQIEKFLAEQPGFEVCNMVRLWPHRIKGEGHFAAKVARLMSEQDCVYRNFNQQDSLSSVSRQAIKEFSEQVWRNGDLWQTLLPADGSVVERSGHIIWEKNCLPSLKGLKVLRSGWLLGMVEKGRFRPSQAFAMGLDEKGVNAAVQRLDLSIQNEQDKYRVIRYLRCETIQEEGKQWSKGWYLVTVDGYPLGWGKGAGYSLKNDYPPGWRWQDSDER
ncbi:Ribosomal RNA small subunit methyltransferase F [bioreactor metagenome]|uniref:Ribosomal RNA small subunit methyltransferase F n=1 Tax=bioreactor metagenome TaxID=1076179 RepID=A0A644VJ67_9ZZZZ|nr:RsmB/NOP family class I SAM-dependent RNA methyltransferase [Negativicutes bacterium]